LLERACPELVERARRELTCLAPFSELVLELPLRGYQLAPAHAILDSVLHRRGLEFLLVFSRQSGKNELVAQVLVYLLNLYQRAGGNVVYAAAGDTLGVGLSRLEERLDNAWNRDQWGKGTRPLRRTLDRAAVIFLSSHPSASARGQTAHHLLVVDEVQDALGSHVEAVFTPMRASHNATAVYVGTVKTTTDYLWQKKRELEAEQAGDGVQRVYLVGPDQVCAEHPAYRLFLERQVAKNGRHHPIVASEYYLEPVDGLGGLFDARRRALMRGDHVRQPLRRGSGQAPHADLYVATLDVAGQDEGATDPVVRLAHPGRDYTVATIFAVDYPPPGIYQPGPSYRALDVYVDHGSRHFEDQPGRPALAQRLLAWLQHWEVAHLVADASGVGLGLAAWLAAALGEARVTQFDFAGTGKKAALGSRFLTLVETGRFRYWSDDEDEVGSDGWWFWRQVEACGYELPEGRRFDRDLKWGVDASHRTDTPSGPQPTHDDRLLSAALVAELDRQLAGGRLVLGRAESAVVPGPDPLADLSF
jgi:hypothetical protein